MADSTLKLKKMTKRQKDYLKVLKNCAGLITHACEKFKIHPQTHYNWVKRYEGFQEEVNDIHESMIDFAESKLFGNIKKGDTTSIIFYLKCRAKNRGYVERQEFEHSGETKQKVDLSALTTEELKNIAKLGD